MAANFRMIRGSGNIFVDLGFGKVEAHNLQLRSHLVTRLIVFYRRSGMTPRATAKKLGIGQRRFGDLVKGRIGRFDLDALVEMANRAGLDVRLVVRKAA